MICSNSTTTTTIDGNNTNATALTTTTTTTMSNGTSRTAVAAAATTVHLNKIMYSPPGSPASVVMSGVAHHHHQPASPTPVVAANNSNHSMNEQMQQRSRDNNNVVTAAGIASINLNSPASGVVTTTTLASAPSSPSLNGGNGSINVPVMSTPIGVGGGSGSGNVGGIGGGMWTPKKSSHVDLMMLQSLREKLRTPRGACELQSLSLTSSSSSSTEPTSLKVIKDRYLISPPCSSPSAVAAKTPASYRHLIDLTCSNLKCTDVFTEEQFLCKIINEPLHKVQRAYFQLQQEGDNCRSLLYGHPLIRGVHDIVPLSRTRTYVIIAAPQAEAAAGEMEFGEQQQQQQRGESIYEDLHTYIRNKRRLDEHEARALFHQICQTVQVCHRNGIILRDLKLKRFYFIDEARTKLQYESLEGSMILNDPADDTLSDKIGCPLYTAPELLCPKPTYRGKPADMWSLGVILYTMLVGQYPFYEKGNCNLITVIRHCHVQIPASLSLSKSVRMLLLALLRKSHEERLPAEFIFHAPWLKEQRPDYMNIPYDICLSDDEAEEETDDEEEEYADDDDVAMETNEQQHQHQHQHSQNMQTEIPTIDYSSQAQAHMDIDQKDDERDESAAATAAATTRSSSSGRHSRHDDGDGVDMG